MAMISQIASQIIKQLSFRNAIEFIGYEIYSKLKSEELEIIKNNFGLKEHRLKVIDCFSCGEWCEVRIRNEQKFIHCLADECGVKKDLNYDQDLAYKTTLNDIADFLIKLLEIGARYKRIIAIGEVIYLGKKELKDFGISCDLYLIKNEQNKNFLLNYHKPQSKKTPAIIIRLGNRNLNFEEKQIVECWFDDLVFYDQEFKKFNINYKTFSEAIKGCFDGLPKSIFQQWLNRRFTEYFIDQLKSNNIKEKTKNYYQNFAFQYFDISPNKFREIWKEYAPKKLKKGGRKPEK